MADVKNLMLNKDYSSWSSFSVCRKEGRLRNSYTMSSVVKNGLKYPSASSPRPHMIDENIAPTKRKKIVYLVSLNITQNAYHQQSHNSCNLDHGVVFSCHVFSRREIDPHTLVPIDPANKTKVLTCHGLELIGNAWLDLNCDAVGFPGKKLR